MKTQTLCNSKFVSRTITLGLILSFTFGALTFTSCRKKEEKIEAVEDTEQGTANDNNAAEAFVADIDAMGSQVSEDGQLAYRGEGDLGVTLELAPEATVTISGKIITVDFGSVGVTGKDGRVRTGKIIYNFSASSSSALYYRNPGFSMNVTSQNYVVDGYQITILNKTVSNTTPSTIPSGTNPGTNLTWAITANVSIVKPNNGGTITWSCARTKELINTSDSTCYRGQSLHIIWSKAIVKLNGNTSGTNAKAEQFTATATNLVRDFNCAPIAGRPMRHPFISGTIVYTPGSRPSRTVDFGNGACDSNATVTIKNRTFSIVL